jgi:hypothetical protein
MPNENPIYIDEKPKLTEFVIPKDYTTTLVYLTIKIELLNKDWKYAASHIIFLKNEDIYPLMAPEPEELKLDYARNLDGKKLRINSHISRFNFSDEDGTKPPKVKYSLVIEAGDDLIGEFSEKSGTNNPVDFNCSILFKTEK